MRIFLTFLGCRLNLAELDLWARQFSEAGHTVVADAGQADLMVLNSCAVTQEAVRKSRKNIKQLKKRNPQARVVVSGCFVSLQDNAANTATAEALAVDLVVHNSDKQRLVADSCNLLDSPNAPSVAHTPANTAANNAAAAATSTPTAHYINVNADRKTGNEVNTNKAGILPHSQLPEKWIPVHAAPQRQRQRAFIKIQDGCRYRCTYCVVTLARGEEASRSIGELVKEVNLLVTEGIKEIVLTGVHVGGYGSDTGESLASLLQALLAETDVPRIRFASVEPWDLEEELLTCMLNPRVMPHMHLPLQSGSDSVLRRMARRCKTGDFRELVEGLQSSVTGFNVTTDIIVGFPGESETEWQQTLEFVESLAFGHIHVFPFSVRAGTKAARLPGQLTGNIKKTRVRQLRELANRQRREFLADCLAQEVDVLWEKYTTTSNDTLIASDSAATVQGYTPNYIKVCAELPLAFANSENKMQQWETTQRDHWVNRITPATLRQLHAIPGKSENDIPEYLIEARLSHELATAPP